MGKKKKSTKPACLVLIPCYNEERGLSKLLARVKQACGHDILVLDDGSSDRTADVAEEAGVMCLRHPVNLGYGAALQSGYKYALESGYDEVVHLDGDGQHDPAGLQTLEQAGRDMPSDIIIGSRFWKGSRYRMPVTRYLGVVVERGLLRFLTGLRISDPTSGFQRLSRRAMALYSRGWFPSDFPDADVLLVAHRMGLSIHEVAVTMYPAADGVSIHSGLKPIYYVFRIFFVMFLIMLQKRSSFLEN
jgi:glycosyltransferase involved in cell wall biosynthesis